MVATDYDAAVVCINAYINIYVCVCVSNLKEGVV